MADGIASRFNTDSYTADDERRLDWVQAWPGGNQLPRPGRRPGPGLSLTVGGSPESVTVSPGHLIVPDGSTTAYKVVIPNAVTKALAARPASGTSRYDIVAAHVYDTDVHPSDTTLREVDIEVFTGTAGATPVAPTLPTNTGILSLGTLTVPATGTISVSPGPQRTVAAGGILPVASQAERDAISPVYDGMVVYREDTDVLEVRAAGKWRPLAGAASATCSGQYTGTINAYLLPGGLIAYVGGCNRASGNNATLHTTGAVFPAGFRPASNSWTAPAPFWAAANSMYRYQVATDGTVNIQESSTVPPGEAMVINLIAPAA